MATAAQNGSPETAHEGVRVKVQEGSLEVPQKISDVDANCTDEFDKTCAKEHLEKLEREAENAAYRAVEYRKAQARKAEEHKARELKNSIRSSGGKLKVVRKLVQVPREPVVCATPHRPQFLKYQQTPLIP